MKLDCAGTLTFRWDLLGTYARGFDDLLPFSKIVPDELSELLRGAGTDIRAVGQKTLLHFWLLQHAHDFAIDFINNRLRRSCWGDNAEPLRCIHCRITGFDKGRHVLESDCALGARHR